MGISMLVIVINLGIARFDGKFVPCLFAFDEFEFQFLKFVFLCIY
jgi:hypothetical protein